MRCSTVCTHSILFRVVRLGDEMSRVGEKPRMSLGAILDGDRPEVFLDGSTTTDGDFAAGQRLPFPDQRLAVAVHHAVPAGILLLVVEVAVIFVEVATWTGNGAWPQSALDLPLAGDLTRSFPPEVALARSWMRHRAGSKMWRRAIANNSKGVVPERVIQWK